MAGNWAEPRPSSRCGEMIPDLSSSWKGKVARLVAPLNEEDSSLDELVGAVSALRGALLVDVGRTLDMPEVGLQHGSDEVRLHIQCPVRILRGSRILLGSQDLRRPHPQADDPQLAFDQYETMFDYAARFITTGFGDGLPVLEAAMRLDGSLHLQAADGIRVEVFPATSGPVECWRLFVKGSGVHHLYPPDAAKPRPDRRQPDSRGELASEAGPVPAAADPAAGQDACQLR